MDLRIIKLAKQEYEDMCNVFDSLEKKGVVSSPSGSMKLRDVLRMDVANYLMYLSASDGQIDPNEVIVYQMITGMRNDADEIREFIEENDIYSTSFGSTVPASLKIAADAEYRIFMVTGETITFPEQVIRMFEKIGQVIIEADGGVTDSERRDYSTYIETLKEHLRNRGF